MSKSQNFTTTFTVLLLILYKSNERRKISSHRLRVKIKQIPLSQRTRRSALRQAGFLGTDGIEITNIQFSNKVSNRHQNMMEEVSDSVEQPMYHMQEEDDDDEAEIDQFKHAVGASQLTNAFSNKQSFSCPLAKPLLHTGDSLANLSPEDIDIVAAMGDALAMLS
ncbi:hypothetical protein DICVIV_04540 [Dictyocaulus viviparus]|uniref:Uncharacterized protein n=1 Tax=Dictyocaulus viviparus TaxID=29172 RepID=A0A0D8XZP1_DICVI|nr:hypothetical protein DICVIV_04540 [Dictyocaulus viviparus]